jgi:hypothetical protein
MVSPTKTCHFKLAIIRAFLWYTKLVSILQATSKKKMPALSKGKNFSNEIYGRA